MIASISQHLASNTISITSREYQVLDQISYGLTTNEIAAKLYLSSHTVMSHRKNLLIKLDARNTAGLIRKAFESGFLTI